MKCMRINLEALIPPTQSGYLKIWKKGGINMNIINSSGKIMGIIRLNECEILINNYHKPLYKITDSEIIKGVVEKNTDIIPILFDNYYLTIAEIASLFEVKYHVMNKIMTKYNLITGMHEGRRNASYGKIVDDEQRYKISIGNIGKHNNSPQYIRTEQIRSKISNKLKNKYKSGTLFVNSRLIKAAWKNGKYDNAKMGRGKQGYVYSIKNSNDIYFRSLLELSYVLKLENDDTVENYISEPCKIEMSNESVYIPDFLINFSDMIELKPIDHLKIYVNSRSRFEMEVKYAKEYCEKHNYSFKILYDADIGFSTRKFTNYLRDNPDIVDKYKIRFV